MSLEHILAAATTLFLVMDPLGNVPLFHSIIGDISPRRRTYIIVRELLIALFILFFFLYCGNYLLQFLRLSQTSLNLSGGILLFIISLRMIYPQTHVGKDIVTEEPFIVPMAIPMIAGPSSISVLLLFSSSQPKQMSMWALALLAAWLASAIILISSPYILRVLGDKGARAIERLMGMILLLLAIQMILNGITDFIVSLPQ